MKLENQLKAFPAINRIELITHFHGPYLSSHFLILFCLVRIVLPGIAETWLSSRGHNHMTVHDKATPGFRILDPDPCFTTRVYDPWKVIAPL